MSIESVGNQKSLIKNHDANSWANTEINTRTFDLNHQI